MSRKPIRRAELDLLPVMNLVSILIPLLLMSVGASEMAVIDASVPEIGEQTHDSDPLGLAVDVGFMGVRLSAARDGAVDAQDWPCSDGCTRPEDLDTRALQAALREVKLAHPDERVIEVRSRDEVPYDVLVALLDASRSEGGAELFPEVRVGVSADR